MWLDSFAILPLVALGTVLLLRDKKYVLYTLSLFFAVVVNYYVGFFVCVFVLLLFFCYELCRFRNPLRFLADFVRIGFFTVLAIGMTAFLELPALAALQETYSSVNAFPEGFQLNMVTGEAVEAAKAAWEAFTAAKEAGTETFSLWWDAVKASIPSVAEGMATVAGQIGGGHTPTYIDGLPNLYCGVLPIAMGFLFLLAREVKLRDKLCCVVLLVFFMLSFLIRQLDYMWHGFHFTNQIPYRFSFLFGFVLLYMGYRAWLLRDGFKLWQILLSGILSAALFLVSPACREDIAYLAFNFAFLGLYFLAMLYGTPGFLPEMPRAEASQEAIEEEAEEIELQEELPAEETLVDIPALLKPEQPEPKPSFLDRFPNAQARSRQAAWVMAGVLMLELTLNLVSFAVSFGIYDYDYPKKWDTVSSMLQVMRDQENGEDLFYRTEMTHTQTLNDGPLNGYYGASTFSSSANANVTRFMKALGCGGYDSWNRYCYEEGSPVTNLFLNLKYLLERDNTPGPNSYFDILHSYDGVTLMENNAYLPLGFLAQPELETVDFKNSDLISFQNQLFKAATGIVKPVWNRVNAADVQVVTENVTMNTSNAGGYSSFSTGDVAGKLMYEYTMTQEGYMCLDLNLYKQKNFSVWHNGTQLYREGYTLPQLLAVCDVQVGDKVQVVVECGAGFQNTSISIRAAVLDAQIFRQGYDILNASTLELTEFSTTHLAGDILCDRDGLLYTSIPQNGNWIAYVDGEKVETTRVGEAMLALHLTQGEHHLEFRYENMAFTYGLLVSLGCGGVFGAIILVHYLLRRRSKKNDP